MKTFFCALALTLTLLAGQAIAAPQAFDSPAGKFSLDIPAGWTAQPVDLGCIVTDDTQKNSMSLQFRKADTDAKTLAKAAVDGMKGTIVKQDESNGVISILCKVDKEDIVVVVVPFEKFLACAIVGGPEKDKMLGLLDSLDEAK